MTSLALEEAWKAVRQAPRNVAARRGLAEALEAAGDPRAPFVKTSLAALEQTLDGHAAALALKAFRATASEWLPHRALMNAWGDDGLGMVGSVFASLEQVLANATLFAELGPQVTLHIATTREPEAAEISALGDLPLERFHQVVLGSEWAPCQLAGMASAQRVELHCNVKAEHVAKLASVRKTPLRALWVNVADSADAEEVVTRVVESESLHGIEHLELGGYKLRLSPKLRARLVKLPALRRLRISGVVVPVTPADELHAAVSTPAKLEALLAAGKAPIDARDFFGLTPLHLACSEGNRASIEVLLRHGADPDARTARGVTPLGALLDARTNARASEILDRIAVAETLLERFPRHIDVADGPGMRPLVRAMELGRNGLPEAKALERKILAMGPNLQAFSHDLFTYLHLAVVFGSAEVFAAALAAGVPVDVRTWHGGTPLWYAAHHDRLEMAEALLDAGADIDATCDGLEPIAVSLRERNRGITRFLLDRGANTQLADPIYAKNLATFMASSRGKKATAKKKAK
jgi:hypothetical protein